LDAFVDVTQAVVTGESRLKLFKGNIRPAGAVAAKSLYLEDLASFTDTALYDQKDASGFIRCFGLPMKTQALVNSKRRAGKGKR
jgi:argininosuccinate synthase